MHIMFKLNTANLKESLNNLGRGTGIERVRADGTGFLCFCFLLESLEC